MSARAGLRSMLLGAPLTQHGGDSSVAALDAHLESVLELLPRVYGDSDASKHAQMEFKSFMALPNSHDGVLCKRAALLFALWREKELAEFYAGEERAAGAVGTTYAEDMHTRVLPFVAPRFLRHSCQAPDAFVVLCSILAEMWPGEQLGNWPLESMPLDDSDDEAGGAEGAAHDDLAGGELADR